MSIDQLKVHIKARPFVPFTIFSADGQTFRVPHEDYISRSPLNGRTVLVYTGGDRHVLLDALLITGLEVETPHEQIS